LVKEESGDVITQICGTCGKKMQFPHEMGGTQSKCPTCGDGFIIGQAPVDDDDDSYGLAGSAKPKPKKAAQPPIKTSAKVSKPTGKTGSSGSKGTTKAPASNELNDDDDESAVPAGKIECPTCHDYVPKDSKTCLYCGDLIDRSGGSGKKKKR
jgi:predicted RNA-binding Zn-ribbon protein involved in translation (DUF1610 family)